MYLFAYLNLHIYSEEKLILKQESSTSEKYEDGHLGNSYLKSTFNFHSEIKL